MGLGLRWEPPCGLDKDPIVSKALGVGQLEWVGGCLRRWLVVLPLAWNRAARVLSCLHH